MTMKTEFLQEVRRKEVAHNEEIATANLLINTADFEITKVDVVSAEQDPEFYGTGTIKYKTDSLSLMSTIAATHIPLNEMMFIEARNYIRPERLISPQDPNPQPIHSSWFVIKKGVKKDTYNLELHWIQLLEEYEQFVKIECAYMYTIYGAMMKDLASEQFLSFYIDDSTFVCCFKRDDKLFNNVLQTIGDNYSDNQ